MTKRLVVLTFSLFLAALPSCASSEQSILITARASGTNPTMIENVSVLIIPVLGTLTPIDRETNPVNRTIQDINGDQPIRIAVHLHDPTPVMIHLVARTASGSTLLYATRCYMPAGVLRDEVLLVPLDVADDADLDGWTSAAHLDASCRDPGPGATGVACDIGLCAALDGATDCNDTPSATSPIDCTVAANQTMGPCIHPGAGFICGDGIDQDCRANGLPGGSLDEPCGDMDGDGVNACGPAGGVCDCNDMDANIHPGATDVCGNGVDEDCSGEPGGMGAFCDADHDTYPSNVDCNDNDPNIHPGGLALEHCDSSPVGGMCGVACRLAGGNCMCDGIDNNCNGLTDEDASCRSPDLDGDGADACAAGVTDCGSCDCNDCDSGIHPGATDYCGDGIDEDGVGGDMPCQAGDTDRDGYVGGQECGPTGEGDPHIHVDAPENCTTATSESCGTMSCPASVDGDTDGFAASSVSGTDCNDTDRMVNPWATEVCNGVDDNCNGDADEVLDPTNRTGCVTDPTCTGGSRCNVDFQTNLHHCGGCRLECNPGTTLVADACVAGHCSCMTNAGGAECAVGSTCCGTTDAMGNPVAHPGCYDTDTSTDNCGGCGNVCDPATADTCSGGRCVCGSTGAACGAGQTCCGGACVNLATDTTHCGRCDRACGPRTACNAGMCGCDDTVMHGDCNGDIGAAGGNGCETDLLSDSTHCGTCAQSCLDEHVATGSCGGGTCVVTTCATLYGNCDTNPGNGCETDLRLVGNCGACGTVCSPMHADAACIVGGGGTTASCGYGSCMPNTFGNCDSNVVNGCETSLRATTTCGACGTDCNTVVQHATPTCSATGTCDYNAGSCTAGSSDCNGSRVDGCELFAPTHCGGACTNCMSTVANATGQSCTAGGTCDYGACTAGTSDCDGSRANGCEPFAATHCGGTCTNCSTAVAHAIGIGCSGAGACTFTACSAGFLDCDAGMLGCETTQDTTHCGAACTNCSSTVANAIGQSCTAGGLCNYASCSAGFSDCNASRADGCERASDGTHCGGSCIDCTAMTQHVSGLACTSGACDYTSCAAGYFDCNPSRADGCEQIQNNRHCGGCLTDCTTMVMNVGSVICTGGGTCGYMGGCTGNSCDADGMATNGCEGTQSPTACGVGCATNCTTGFMHGTAGCTGGSCTVASCMGGFANCDSDPTNGCEMNSPGNNTDCCGVMCAGAQTCMGTAATGYRCM